MKKNIEEDTEDTADIIVMHNSQIFKIQKQGARIQNIIYLCNNQLFKLYINSNSVPDQSMFIIYTHSVNGWIEFVTGLISSVSNINAAHVEDIDPIMFDEVIKHAEGIIVRCSRFLPQVQHTNNLKDK